MSRNKLKVGGIVYSVLRQKEPIIQDDSLLAGRVVYQEARIELHSTPDAQYSMETFLHEKNHIILRQSQLERMIPADKMEEFVEAFSHWELMVLRDNAWLMREIQKL